MNTTEQALDLDPFNEALKKEYQEKLEKVKENYKKFDQQLSNWSQRSFRTGSKEATLALAKQLGADYEVIQKLVARMRGEFGCMTRLGLTKLPEFTETQFNEDEKTINNTQDSRCIRWCKDFLKVDGVYTRDDKGEKVLLRDAKGQRLKDVTQSARQAAMAYYKASGRPEPTRLLGGMITIFNSADDAKHYDQCLIRAVENDHARNAPLAPDLGEATIPAKVGDDPSPALSAYGGS